MFDKRMVRRETTHYIRNLLSLRRSEGLTNPKTPRRKIAQSAMAEMQMATQHLPMHAQHQNRRDYLWVPKLGAPLQRSLWCTYSHMGGPNIQGCKPFTFQSKGKVGQTGQNRMAVLFWEFLLIQMGFRCDSRWVGKGSSLAFQQVVDQPKRSPYEKIMAQTVKHGPGGRGGSGIKWALAQIYSKL